MNGRGVAQLMVPPMVIVVTWVGLAWLPGALSGHDDADLFDEEFGDAFDEDGEPIEEAGA